LPKPARTLSK